MTDTITLLTFSLFLLLQNDYSHGVFNVSAPLDHTLNEDGSVIVKCEHDEHKDWEWDAKLKMNGNEVVCEVSLENNMNSKCNWKHEGNTFKFTLKNLEARHKDKLFFCEISKVSPIPIISRRGKETKLFQGSNIHFPPPGRTCSCPTPTSGQKSCPSQNSPGNTYELLMGIMIIGLVLLSLYSAIITGVYIRLRVTKDKSTDNPTYMPMKRKVKQKDADNTEYVDMRKVQKQGHNRDININC